MPEENIVDHGPTSILDLSGLAISFVRDEEIGKVDHCLKVFLPCGLMEVNRSNLANLT